MWEHTKHVSQSCFYHIRAFHYICAVLDKSTAADIAAALVCSRLHYANSVLNGSPSRCLTRLQRIQNSVAWTVLQQPLLSSRDTLQQIHWLPVKWRIQFKLASLTYKVLHTGTPSYLSERLHPYIPSRTLQSSSSANLYVPRTNLHFGLRSFHHAAPTVWIFLPSTLRSSQTLNTFQKHIKTIFTSLLLIASSDLSSASDSFSWMIITYLLTSLVSYTRLGLERPLNRTREKVECMFQTPKCYTCIEEI